MVIGVNIFDAFPSSLLCVYFIAVIIIHTCTHTACVKFCDL